MSVRMKVKIENIDKTKLILRECPICEKMVEMERFIRFCSPVCRTSATRQDTSMYEYKYAIPKGRQ